MTDASRPLHALIRELASAPSADADRVPVMRDSLLAWADRLEELEAENARIRKASKLLPGILDDYATTVDAAGQAIANGQPVNISLDTRFMSAADIAASIRKRADDLRAALTR